MQYGQLVSVIPEYETGEWVFELMIDREAFTIIPNSLETGGKNYPVIVTRRRPACWKCDMICHFAPSCPDKKVSGVSPVRFQSSSSWNLVPWHLLSMQKFSDKDIEDPWSFSDAKRVRYQDWLGVPAVMGDGGRGCQRPGHYTHLGNLGKRGSQKVEAFLLRECPSFC